MMMILRPILSDSQPKDEPGVPITSEAAISRLAVLPSTLAEGWSGRTARNWPEYHHTGGQRWGPSSTGDHDLQVFPLTGRFRRGRAGTSSSGRRATRSSTSGSHTEIANGKIRDQEPEHADPNRTRCP